MRQVELVKGAGLDELDESETVSLRVKNVVKKRMKEGKKEERRNKK